MAKAPMSSVAQFLAALHDDDVARARALLESDAQVRAAVNAPVSDFDSRPLARAKKNLPMVDLLLSYGADLNLKSGWWAGGFGLLEYDCTPEEAAPLIARGAVVDIVAASHLGMFDRVRALVEHDRTLVHARGGDGKTPLHCASTVEIARYLLDHGAEIDARDVDHESTPAQYLAREAPDVARLLIERGAAPDIFLAVALGDRALVRRCLSDDADALDHRTGQGRYSVAHNGRRPATPDEIGRRRGDIYRWVFGHNLSAVDIASRLGNKDVIDLLLRHASPAQRLLAACALADGVAARAVIAAHPDVISNLTRPQMRLIADKTHAEDTAAVALMLDLGFDARVAGPDEADALHWAAFLGNVELTRLLLHYDPPIGVREPIHGGTPLDWCVHGSLHGWRKDTGDFAGVARLLIDAGEPVDSDRRPSGRDDVDAVILRRTHG